MNVWEINKVTRLQTIRGIPQFAADTPIEGPQ